MCCGSFQFVEKIRPREKFQISKFLSKKIEQYTRKNTENIFLCLQSKKVFDVLSALQIKHKSIEGKCDAAINNNNNVLPVKETIPKK